MKKIIKYLVGVSIRIYFSLRRRYWFWFYFLNRKSRNLFLKALPRLDDMQKRIISDLNKSGIAIIDLNELFPSGNLLLDFQKYFKKIYPQASKNHPTKDFLLCMWGARPEVNLENPFVRFALNEKILNIVNSYVGMQYKFYLMSLNETQVTREKIGIASQRWHRDPEDVIVVKIFIYLNDVDENNGNFAYVKESHFLGKWRNIFPPRPPFRQYPMAIDKIIPKGYVKECIGKAGTVIFCETTGLHKGGFCKKRPRAMFTAAYYSSAAVTPFYLSCKNPTNQMYAFSPNYNGVSSYIYKHRRKFIKKEKL